MATKHTLDTFRIYPEYRDTFSVTLESEYLRELPLASPETPILFPTELFNAAMEELAEDELLVWFRGKNAIAQLTPKDADFTALDKKADLTVVITEKHIAEDGDNNNLVTFILPVEFLDASLDEIDEARKTVLKKVTVTTTYWQDTPKVPMFKSLFNRMIATDPSKCMITLSFDSDGNKQILDRLHCKSKTSSFGIVLNDTKELWQVSILTKQASRFTKLHTLEPGAFVTKQEAAKLYDISNITRYFQSPPTFIIINNMEQLHNPDGDNYTVAMYRAAGLVSYEIVQLDTMSL